MSRSEFLFWATGLAIFLLSGIVVVVTSHNRHSHRGYITPSIIQHLALHRSVTTGLNFTQNRRFEFAVAAAAGAVD